MKLSKLIEIDHHLFLSAHKWTLKHSHLKNGMRIITKASSKVFALAYALSIAVLFYRHDSRLIGFLGVPALVLGVTTLIRKQINRQRPFECLEIEAGIEHESGASFPSKHASSAMIIALAIFWINPIVGMVMILLALLTAVSRVFTGVHFPFDILAGIGIALIGGLLFLWF